MVLGAEALKSRSLSVYDINQLALAACSKVYKDETGKDLLSDVVADKQEVAQAIQRQQEAREEAQQKAAFSDVSAGIIQSVADNFSWGGSTSYAYQNKSDYYTGRWIGDIISLGMGLGEIMAGALADAGMWGGIGVAEVFSFGAASVAIPAAVAGTVATAALIGHGAGIVYSASKNLGSDFDESKQKNGTPGNNQAQNKSVNDAVKEANLSKEGREMLHREISHQNYSYNEILEIAKDIAEMGGKYVK